MHCPYRLDRLCTMIYFHDHLQKEMSLVAMATIPVGHHTEQECIRMGVCVRACSSVKFETGRNFAPVLKITAHAA